MCPLANITHQALPNLRFPSFPLLSPPSFNHNPFALPCPHFLSSSSSPLASLLVFSSPRSFSGPLWISFFVHYLLSLFLASVVFSHLLSSFSCSLNLYLELYFQSSPSSASLSSHLACPLPLSVPLSFSSATPPLPPPGRQPVSYLFCSIKVRSALVKQRTLLLEARRPPSFSTCLLASTAPPSRQRHRRPLPANPYRGGEPNQCDTRRPPTDTHCPQLQSMLRANDAACMLANQSDGKEVSSLGVVGGSALALVVEEGKGRRKRYRVRRRQIIDDNLFPLLATPRDGPHVTPILSRSDEEGTHMANILALLLQYNISCRVHLRFRLCTKRYDTIRCCNKTEKNTIRYERKETKALETKDEPSKRSEAHQDARRRHSYARRVRTSSKDNENHDKARHWIYASQTTYVLNKTFIYHGRAALPRPAASTRRRKHGLVCVPSPERWQPPAAAHHLPRSTICPAPAVYGRLGACTNTSQPHHPARARAAGARCLDGSLPSLPHEKLPLLASTHLWPES